MTHAPTIAQLSLFEEAPPASARAGGRTEVPTNLRWIQLQGAALSYALKRGKRRTIGFSIDDAGLTIAAPRWVGIAEIEAAIHEKARWIVAKLAEWREHRARMPVLEWHDGGCIPLFGATVTLRLAPQARDVTLEGATLTLPLALDATTAQIRDRVQGWMQTRARGLFAERLAVYCERLGLAVGAWRLSSARTRWGSCTSDGAIRLNWRLLHYPMSVIDYVVAHEVAHRHELHHGPKFWETVESIFPAFRDAEALLKFQAPGMFEGDAASRRG